MGAGQEMNRMPIKPHTVSSEQVLNVWLDELSHSIAKGLHCEEILQYLEQDETTELYPSRNRSAI